MGDSSRLISRLNAFTEERLTYSEMPSRGELIVDPVWGTQYYHPWEVAVITTPLLQRLRYVRQTSLAYLTFPSATHSRYEHSLGTAAVADRMLSCMNVRSNEQFSDADILSIRLAGLLHDVGHTLLSHTGEGIAGKHPDLVALRESDTRFHGAATHEMISYCIVTSPAFRSFFGRLMHNYCGERPSLSEVSLDEVAGFIIGHASDGRRLLADVINGGFDADKLDYLARDSIATGVPAMHDANALFYSLQSVKYERVGSEVRLSSAQDAPTGLAIGIAGVSVLQDLLLSKQRIALSVHMNTGVRATDLAVRSYFRALGDNAGLVDPSNRFDDTLDFLEKSNDAAVFSGPHELEYLARVSQGLQAGRLPRLAAVISRKTCSNLARVLRLQGEEDILESLEGEIYERLALESRSHELTRYDVSIDLPKQPSMREASQALVVLHDGELAMLGDVMPLGQWIASLLAFQWHGGVYVPDGPDRQRLRVARITRDVLHDRCEVDLNEYAWIEAGLSPAEVLSA